MGPDNCPVGSRVPVRIVFWVLPATEGRHETIKAQLGSARHDGNSGLILTELGQLFPTPQPQDYIQLVINRPEGSCSPNCMYVSELIQKHHHDDKKKKKKKNVGGI